MFSFIVNAKGAMFFNQSKENMYDVYEYFIIFGWNREDASPRNLLADKLNGFLKKIFCKNHTKHKIAVLKLITFK